MKALVAVLSLALATPDAGFDAGDTLESRGVYLVNSAVSCRSFDGGSCVPVELGEGWWLTRERMKETGTKLVELQNALDARDQADAQRPSWLTSGLIGFCVGVSVGALGMIYLTTKK